MQARQVGRVAAQQAGLAQGLFEQGAETAQEAGLLLAVVGVGVSSRSAEKRSPVP
jgi:hypothetical protein